MLLAIPVWSADYADNFKQYRFQMKRKLGIDTSSVEPSDTTLNQFVREAIIKVSPIIQSNKASFNFNTTFRSNSYSLDTAVTGILSVYWSKNDSIKTLIKAPMETWYTLLSAEESMLSGKSAWQNRPSYYDYRDGYIVLFPTPIRNGDTIRYDAFTKIKDISGPTVDLTTIPQKYRVAIVEYATYLLAQNLQHSAGTLIKQDFDESVSLLLNRGANVTVSDK